MANNDLQAGLVRKLLKVELPGSRAVAVAAPRVGHDEQLGGVRMGVFPYARPPTSYALDREFGRIVVDADVNPSFVRADVADAIGHRAAKANKTEAASTPAARRTGWGPTNLRG